MIALSLELFKLFISETDLEFDNKNEGNYIQMALQLCRRNKGKYKVSADSSPSLS
jgi:hypothetical protein